MGSQKSPALDTALKPLRDLQDRELERYKIRLAYSRRRQHKYKRDMREWNTRAGGRLPREPKEPTARRLFVGDITVPAVARLLRDNPRGLLVFRDELAGWFRSFREGDAASWCEMFGARSLIVDRGSGKERTIHAPRASVSVTGSTQPAILARILGRDLRESGLVARLLLAAPPPRRVEWTESTPSDGAREAVTALFEGLLSLEPAHRRRNEWQPKVLSLKPSGKKAWIRFYDAFAEERMAVSGDLAAAFAKLEAYAARLALVAHCIRQAAGDAKHAAEPAGCEPYIVAWIVSHLVEAIAAEVASNEVVSIPGFMVVGPWRRKGQGVCVPRFQTSQAFRDYLLTDGCREGANRKLQAHRRRRRKKLMNLPKAQKEFRVRVEAQSRRFLEDLDALSERGAFLGTHWPHEVP